MKITYNIDEDINRIKTGDTVLISGLYGKNFKFINNKFGKIRNIFLRSEGRNVFNIAEIELFYDKSIHSVNFDFIYKIEITDKIVDNVVQHVVTIENPLMYYIHKKNINHTMNFRDELCQQMGICVDKNGKSYVILFSGIN